MVYGTADTAKKTEIKRMECGVFAQDCVTLWPYLLVHKINCGVPLSILCALEHLVKI